MARNMVEPRTALALLEFADAAGAQLLRQHSLAVSDRRFAPDCQLLISLQSSSSKDYWQCPHLVQSECTHLQMLDGEACCPSFKGILEQVSQLCSSEPVCVDTRRLGTDCVGGFQVALANLDAVLLESRGTFEMLPEHVLLQLEEMQRLQNPRASASPQADSEFLRPSCCFHQIWPACKVAWVYIMMKDVSLVSVSSCCLEGCTSLHGAPPS